MHTNCDNATELTPLTDGLYRNRYKNKNDSSLFTSKGIDYYIHCLKHIWSQVSVYFWKLAVFILILIIINTILRSLFKQNTNLIFTSSLSDSNNNLNSNYALSNAVIPPNLIWIVTDSPLQTSNSDYLNTLSKQGILLQNYHISTANVPESMNRVSALISKYVYTLTDSDINNAYFDAFISQKYETHTLYDIDTEQFRKYIAMNRNFPFLFYIILDQQTLSAFESKINDIISCLKTAKNEEIWQNTLLVINSDNNAVNNNVFSLLFGPRIPNKMRGIESEVLFHSIDWQPTLLHFSEDLSMEIESEGFDLWNSLVYGKESPRQFIPMENDIQVTDEKMNGITIEHFV